MSGGALSFNLMSVTDRSQRRAALTANIHLKDEESIPENGAGG
jgi:hypothetical protein